MKKYYAKLLDHVNKLLQVMTTAAEVSRTLDAQYKKGAVSKTEYDTQRTQNSETLAAIRREEVEAIRQLQSSAYNHINRRYGVTAEGLTNDAQLFTGGHIRFSRGELELWAEKYKDNPTMLRIISEYCRENDIDPVTDITSAVGTRNAWDAACVDAMRCASFSATPIRTALVQHYLESTMQASCDTDE